MLLVDGRLIDASTVSVATDSTLWRGGGWFESLAVFRNDVYNLRAHLERLRNGLSGHLEQVLPEDLSDRLRALGKEHQGPGRMKIVVWKEEGRGRYAAWVRDYEPPSPETYRGGVALDVDLRSHPPRWPQSHQKRTAYAHVMQARDGTDAWDVLYCGLDGRPWETGVANVFWIRDGILYSPPARSHLLPGTVLDALTDHASAVGLEVRRLSEPWTRLGNYVGVCNALVGMLPVRRLGDRRFPVETGESVWEELRREMLSDRVWPDWNDVES